jgi:hypothetical protein
MVWGDSRVRSRIKCMISIYLPGTNSKKLTFSYSHFSYLLAINKSKFSWSDSIFWQAPFKKKSYGMWYYYYYYRITYVVEYLCWVILVVYGQPTTFVKSTIFKSWSRCTKTVQCSCCNHQPGFVLFLTLRLA